MPFIEVIDQDATEEMRELATSGMTEALCDAFKIKPEIVTCYYFSAPNYSYGHASKFGRNAENFRMFIKVHAFPRPQASKNEAARTMTEAVERAYGIDPKHIIVYFCDREPSDAFHAGLPSA
ncbi:hypothetical protein [Roseibium aggregatum]|uniref:Phenylpyruvate tautomerase PptA (4-oxalocrotonate tautomerase family) n=1 Tax=Roseibium aggregatum TaxID=187304 RepID=A0A939ELD1_9HYPH|nr:hypothetical protein [Roseibium aggregatum]MBN9673914.1 hypothetical protein [Roseibium aggregatum]